MPRLILTNHHFIFDGIPFVGGKEIILHHPLILILTSHSHSHSHPLCLSHL